MGSVLACAGMSPALQWSGMAATVFGLFVGLSCLIGLVASFVPGPRRRLPKLRLGSALGLLVSILALGYGSMTLLLRCGP